ncbi:MAG: NAD(P)H-dependent oxidoreductase [Thermodesulfobacteriota bacterium]
MKRLNKGKQVFLYVAPFPALAFFKIWASSGRAPETLLIVACAMLAYGIVIVALAYRWDRPTYFDWATTAYFALLSAALLAWPGLAGRFISEYAVTGIYLCLFSAVFLPPLLGKDPFTYHYAKKYTPQIVWDNPIFVRINRIMTHVWSGVFGLCVLLSLYPSILTRAVFPLALILGFGLPFNLRFPDSYLRRLGLPSLSEQRRMARAPTGNSAEDRPPAPGPAQRSVPPRSSDVPTRYEPISPIPGKEKPMKVLALNSSPRTGGQSKTELLLSRLVAGMQEAGAEVEVVELRKKTIKHCIGCFTCWTKTPGRCIHQDDMSRELFPRWLEADLVVYATPLYHFTVNALMKAFIERTLPVLQPFFELGKERTHHPLRHAIPRTVFLSVAGFPEMSVFDQLSSWVRFIFGRSHDLLAEIYRPGAESLTHPFVKDKARDVLDATVQAGREIVTAGAVTPETMARVTQDVVPDRDLFLKIGNLMWKTCIAEGITPKEFEEKGVIPRPDSLETFMLVMPMGFNRDAGSDLEAVLQFRFSGETEGSCHFRISKGDITATEGTAAKADLTIETPFEVWMDIMTKKQDGQRAFMEGKFKVSGDFNLLLRMNELFGRNP